MKKKDFLNCINNNSVEILRDFLLKDSPAYLGTYDDLGTGTITKIWAGDYVYHLLKKKKITEKQLMWLLDITDNEHMSWVDYIVVNDRTASAFLSMLTLLRRSGLLSENSFGEIIFRHMKSGLNFITLLIINNKKDSFNELLNQLLKLREENLISSQTIFSGLNQTNEENQTVLHYIMNNLTEWMLSFFDFLKSCIDKNYLQPKDVLLLLGVKNKSEKHAFDLLKKVDNLKPLLILFVKIYERSNELFIPIIEVLSYSNGNLSLLHQFFRLEYTALMQPLFAALNVTSNLLAFTSALANNTRNNCLNLLTKPANVNAYSQLIDYFLNFGLIHTFLDSDDPDDKAAETLFELLRKILFSRNNAGVIHLNYVLDKTNLPILKIINLHKSVLLNYKKLSTLSFPESLIEEDENGWTLFHIAARYLKANQMEEFFNFFISKVREVQNTRIPTTTLDDKDKEVPKPKSLENYVQQLLTETKGKPSFIYLLGTYQSVDSLNSILSSIKHITLKNPKLRLLFLQVIQFNLKYIRENIKPDDYIFLSNIIIEHIEKTFSLTEDLLEEEVICLESLADLFPAANYILYKHFKESSNAKAKKYFDIALQKNYSLAELEKAIQELNQIIPSDKAFQTLYAKTSHDDFMCLLEKGKKFIFEYEYIKIYKKILSVKGEHSDFLFFELGKIYYNTGDKKSALTYFHKIPLDRPSLFAEKHYELYLNFMQIFSPERNSDKEWKDLKDEDFNDIEDISNIYIILRHLQFAKILSHELNELDLQTQDEFFGRFPLLSYLLDLELNLTLKQLNSSVALKIKNYILNLSAEKDHLFIIETCKLLSSWVKSENCTLEALLLFDKAFEGKRFASNSDYIAVLEYLLNKNLAFFIIGKIFYDSQNLSQALSYFQKINLDTFSLSVEQHYELFIILQNLVVPKKNKEKQEDLSQSSLKVIPNLSHMYTIVRHLHLAKLLGYLPDDSDLAVQNDLYGKAPLLKALLNLELQFNTKKLISLTVLNIKEAILNFNNEKNQALIIEACHVLLTWSMSDDFTIESFNDFENNLKGRRFLSELDYATMLEALLGQNQAYFKIGKIYCKLDNISQALTYFQRIQLDKPTLSAEQHYELYVIFQHLFTPVKDSNKGEIFSAASVNDIKNISHIYTILRHLQLAQLLGYQFDNPKLVTAVPNKFYAKIPLLECLLNLELSFNMKDMVSLIVLNIKNAILNYNNEKNESLIIEACHKLLTWVTSNDFNPEKFRTIDENLKAKHFLFEADYIVMLEQLFDKPVAFFEIGRIYYNLNNKSQALTYFQKIPLDKSSLSGVQHYELGFYFIHLFLNLDAQNVITLNELKKIDNIHYLRTILRHFQLAQLNDNPFNSLDSSVFNLLLNNDVLVKALIDLESIFDKTLSTHISITFKIKESLLALIPVIEENQRPLIVEVCEMLSNWFLKENFKAENVGLFQKSFDNIKSKILSQSKFPFFSTLSPFYPLLSVIKELLEIVGKLENQPVIEIF